MQTYKLGKNPAKIDKRTLKLKVILDAITLPALPVSYEVDVDGLKVAIPEQMFGNDAWGDCVICGRANQTLRFEQFQQDKIVPITTDICLNEYWSEEAQEGDGSACKFLNWIGGRGWNYHPDNGLNMLDSLNEWRQKGWVLGDGNTYTIYAFAQLALQNAQELQYAVYLLGGAYIGIQVPQSAMDQFNAGQIWDVSGDSTIVGGHCLYVEGFNETGPICITWGKRQPMTWNFYNTYCDEAYALVMNRDIFVSNNPCDVNLLDNYLQAITTQSS